MSKDVSFQLDQSAGAEILQNLAEATIRKAAEAIAARAKSMASSLSSNPPEITVTQEVGTIKRGLRSIATVRATGTDAHTNYVGRMALFKSKDAGRVS